MTFHGQLQILLVGFEIVGRQIAETVFQIDVNISVFIYNDFFNENLNVRPNQTFLKFLAENLKNMGYPMHKKKFTTYMEHLLNLGLVEKTGI